MVVADHGCSRASALRGSSDVLCVRIVLAVAVAVDVCLFCAARACVASTVVCAFRRAHPCMAAVAWCCFAVHGDCCSVIYQGASLCMVAAIVC
eukprot:366021-Chlamydomonas_euryale.AAC.18